MSDFRDSLVTALGNSNNDISKYVWKGQKKINSKGDYDQDSIRLIDATDDQLRQFYQFCKTMLFNSDPKFPGRITLLNIINDQRNRCGVELFYRKTREEKGHSSFSVVEAIQRSLETNEISNEEIVSLTLGNLVHTTSEFENLPLDLVIDGGLSKLGKFDRKHMTLTFIVKQGIWFSEEEQKEYAEYKTGPDKLKAVKTKLRIPADLNLNFNAVTGLTVKEMKSILLLRSKRYSDLTIEQLSVLRYKLLFVLEDQVNEHIAQWNTRINQLKQVANARSIELK